MCGPDCLNSTSGLLMGSKPGCIPVSLFLIKRYNELYGLNQWCFFVVLMVLPYMCAELKTLGCVLAACTVISYRELLFSLFSVSKSKWSIFLLGWFLRYFIGWIYVTLMIGRPHWWHLMPTNMALMVSWCNCVGVLY